MFGTSREMLLSMEVYIIWKRFGAILNVLQKALDKDLHWKPEMRGSWLVCVAGSAHFLPPPCFPGSLPEGNKTL